MQKDLKLEKYIDLKGFSCPIPVLKANKAIGMLSRNDILICEVTDPAAPADFKAFCNNGAYDLLKCEKYGSSWIIEIKIIN